MSVVKLIAYYTEPVSEYGEEIVNTLSNQQSDVQAYIDKRNADCVIVDAYGKHQTSQYQLVHSYQETVDRKKRRFPVLEKALQDCKRLCAWLIVPDMQDLIRNEAFTQILQQYAVDFICLDQPSITRVTLPTLVETFQKMRLRHSQRIRHALKQTVAKLGNPNALREITKVNKPKRENAVMFALMLSPIIDHYKKQGFSQRKIVDALNQDGYLAPEGGLWVLSQLQKVLERIEINQIALNLSDILREFDEKGYSIEQQVKALNAMNIRTPNRSLWDINLVEKVRDRLSMIKDIAAFNHFVLRVFPMLLDLQADGLSDLEIADKLNIAQVPIPERLLWELQQDEQSDPVAIDHWTADEIVLAKAVAGRRSQDVYQLVNKHTVERAVACLSDEGN